MDKYRLNYGILARRIKQARHEKGFSQSKLAELAGVSTNMIAKLEINYTTVSLRTILNIANALEVDINYFVSDGPTRGKQADDLFIESMLQDFDARDKQLLIQVITALKTYKRQPQVSCKMNCPNQ